MKLANPKGTRDFLPEDKRRRILITNNCTSAFWLFGYNPLETPALEFFSTLSSKYAGGSEILKETYTLEDNAKRKLGLRYDLTVPLARVIAMNPQLKFPFKRYQIGNVWRDGPLKTGRYREFEQCDADIIGTSSLMADAEIIALTAQVFEFCELKVTIRYNNRKLLNSLLDYLKIPKEKQDSIIITIDKLEKIGFEGVIKELKEKKVNNEQIKKLKAILSTKGLQKVKSLLKESEGLKEIEQLTKYLKQFKVNNAVFDISLARGLSYYTGTVFEVFLKDNTIASSLAAGGRYDNLIGALAGKNEKIPAVGISFGVDVIAEVMKLKKGKKEQSWTKVFIIPIKTEKQSIELITTLRKNKISADIDLSERGISKNLKFADQYQIPYVILLGEDELKKGKYKLRDMKTGKEKDLNKNELIKQLRGKNE